MNKENKSRILKQTEFEKQVKKIIIKTKKHLEHQNKKSTADNINQPTTKYQAGNAQWVGPK